jgi:hypothetical protein
VSARGFATRAASDDGVFVMKDEDAEPQFSPTTRDPHEHDLTRVASLRAENRLGAQ